MLTLEAADDLEALGSFVAFGFLAKPSETTLISAKKSQILTRLFASMPTSEELEADDKTPDSCSAGSHLSTDELAPGQAPNAAAKPAAKAPAKAAAKAGNIFK